MGTEVFDVAVVKALSFSFLEANDLTFTLCNLVSDGIPFLVRVDSSDIPIQNLPILVVSHLKQVKSETRGRRKTDFHAGTQSQSKNQEKSRSTSTIKKDKAAKVKSNQQEFT